MANFVAADVVVAILDKGIVGKKRRSYGTITLNTTLATYNNPGGIYLPAYDSFGFWKQIDQMFLALSPSTAGTAASDGLVYKYDKTLHTIRLFRTAGFTPVGANTAEATHVHVENAAGSYTQSANTAAGASHNHVFTGTAVAAAGLTEFANATVITAATSLILYFDAIGV